MSFTSKIYTLEDNNVVCVSEESGNTIITCSNSVAGKKLFAFLAAQISSDSALTGAHTTKREGSGEFLVMRGGRLVGVTGEEYKPPENLLLAGLHGTAVCAAIEQFKSSQAEAGPVAGTGTVSDTAYRPRATASILAPDNILERLREERNGGDRRH